MGKPSTKSTTWVCIPINSSIIWVVGISIGWILAHLIAGRGFGGDTFLEDVYQNTHRVARATRRNRLETWPSVRFMEEKLLGYRRVAGKCRFVG
jgi:hypothetical protein